MFFLAKIVDVALVSTMVNEASKGQLSFCNSFVGQRFVCTVLIWNITLQLRPTELIVTVQQ